jgi:hypothetical protein
MEQFGVKLNLWENYGEIHERKKTSAVLAP